MTGIHRRAQYNACRQWTRVAGTITDAAMARIGRMYQHPRSASPRAVPWRHPGASAHILRSSVLERLETPVFPLAHVPWALFDNRVASRPHRRDAGGTVASLGTDATRAAIDAGRGAPLDQAATAGRHCRRDAGGHARLRVGHYLSPTWRIGVGASGHLDPDLHQYNRPGPHLAALSALRERAGSRAR